MEAIQVAPGVEISDPRRGAFIKEELLAINKRAGELILKNGLLLREYKSAGYFKEDGYDSFDEAIEALKAAGQLDYGARQARNFIAIIDLVEALQLSQGEIDGIGPSKLREIASLKDRTEQQKLIDAAKDTPYADIQKEAKRLRDKAAGRDVDPLSPVTLMFTETQKLLFKDAINAARVVSGMPDNAPEAAVLADVILAEFMSGIPNGNYSRVQGEVPEATPAETAEAPQ